MNRDGVERFCEEMRGTPFIWGNIDCTTFPLACFDILRGKDDSLALIGKWKDEAEARKFSDDNKVTIESWLLDRGCVRIRPGMAQRGELALYPIILNDGREWLTAAVFLGKYCMICVEQGVRLVLTSGRDLNYILGIR